MSQQQYSYGYGYPAGYGYGQTSAAPVASYMVPPTQQPAAVQPRMQSYTSTATPTMPQPQVPPVGYSPYPSTPKPPPPPPTPPVNPTASTYYAQPVPPNPQQQAAAAASYYGYQSYQAPTPAPTYPPYYPSQQQQTPKATVATTITHPSYQTASSASYQAPVASYTPPVYNPSPVGQAQSKPNVGTPQMTASVAYPTVSTFKPKVVSPQVLSKPPQYNPPSAPQGAPQAAQNLTPQQKQVIAQYIHTKSQPVGVPGGQAKVPYWKRKPSTTPTQEFYCEVCRISAACSGTYKTHLEGKNHKKKLIQQKLAGQADKKACDYYCELCDIICSNSDSLEAHNKGSKHQKVLNLHRRLGKPIPTMKLVNGASADGKKVLAGPKIMFVGGKTLHSTNQTEDSKEGIKVYPPPVVTTPKPPNLFQKATPTQPTSAKAKEEEKDVEAVGEELVKMVKGDPKFPHALFKCDMCDCYFNDDYAKRAHIKGRRHRMNYKKMYEPNLYVEPTSTQKKEAEKKKKQKEAQRERFSGMGRRHDSFPGSENLFAGMQIETPQEELPEEDNWDGGWDPYMNPDPYRDPHDDVLVMNKHKSIYPLRPEMKAVETVVADVEKALKLISDDLLVGEASTMMGNQKDESLRVLKGVMRIGSFAHCVLLKGECSVELVLMCSAKPTMVLFNSVTNKLAARFEAFNKNSESENIYNITPLPDKAALTIISQVGDYRVIVSITFTSNLMRHDPSALQMQADQSEGVLNRQCCIAALAALRHTKWFQTMSHGTPTCAIILRVMKDICRRVPAWGVLDAWMLELLVQKCILTCNPEFSQPGDLFRRVMECAASGVFLPGGKGLLDPCEKKPLDACAPLTAADRSNLTLSAQHALRLIAFNKLHLVLGVDPLPGHKQPEPLFGANDEPKNATAGGKGPEGADDMSIKEVGSRSGVKRSPGNVQDGASTKKIKLEEEK